jgi:hypothetical protein
MEDRIAWGFDLGWVCDCELFLGCGDFWFAGLAVFVDFVGDGDRYYWNVWYWFNVGDKIIFLFLL